MDRRHFSRLMAMGAGALSFPSPAIFAQPRPDRPNVLFIILEDLPDWPGCMGGHPDARTPNLDAFADRGVLFTNAHCSVPACNPSRTAMFTGIQPHNSGVYTNDDDWRLLMPGVVTMPEHFQLNGYTTTRSGKFFQPFFERPEAWTEHFSTARPHTMSGRDPYSPYHPFNGLPRSIQNRFNFNWGPTDEPMEAMADVRRSDHLIGMLQEGRPAPWFAAFGPTKAHFPAVVPRRYWERYNPASLTLPPFLENDLDDLPHMALEFIDERLHEETVSHKQWRKAMQSYLAAIEYLDDMVGRVLTAWYDSPYSQDGIVVMMADHGFHLGEKHHWRKWTLWNEATQVYFAIDAPGVTPPGGRCHQAVSLLDVFPTLVDLCNLEGVDGLEGESLLPQLMDPSTPRIRPALITQTAGNHAVVDEFWRYIRYADGTEEMYNRVFDPNEWINQAGNPFLRPIMDWLALWMPDDGRGPRTVARPAKH